MIYLWVKELTVKLKLKLLNYNKSTSNNARPKRFLANQTATDHSFVETLTSIIDEIYVINL